MTRCAVAVVTGFTRSAALVERSFATLVALKRAGLLDRILYVTWDRSDIDAYLAPVRRIEEVELVRIAEPKVCGNRLFTGVSCQISNLADALARIDGDDTLVVKLRPDFIADETFLRAKIRDFDSVCAPSGLADSFGVPMPPSPFGAKIWLPWADAGLPLHFEDAAFIGRKADVAKLAVGEAADPLAACDDRETVYGWFSHAARYAAVFLPDYPLFRNYIANFRYFMNDAPYRMAMMPDAIREPFFWRLVIANAWILATSFHIDAGRAGQLAFYSNASNRNADWSNIHALKSHPPYNAVDEWRQAQAPGGMFPCLGRIHARLVDDSWQHALFTRPALADLTPDNLRGALGRVLAYRPHDPDPAEAPFYRTLDRHFMARQAAMVPDDAAA
jgi:hypothetical protein